LRASTLICSRLLDTTIAGLRLCGRRLAIETVLFIPYQTINHCWRINSGIGVQTQGEAPIIGSRYLQKWFIGNATKLKGTVEIE
jgi:hypothetical protein